MARRLFEGEDAWTEEASRAANSVQVALADILALMEADGPVDLRDFHYMASSTVGTFVAGLSITRRLGDPTSPPNPIIYAYPRLSDNLVDDEEDMCILEADEHEYAWMELSI